VARAAHAGPAVLPPLLQLVVFGYAVTLDVDHARIGWMDMDRTPEAARCGRASKAPAVST